MIGLMSSEELEGVAEETLFRNYTRKVELGSEVVRKLLKLEQILMTGEVDRKEEERVELERRAVIWKLKRVARSDPSCNLKGVLELIG